MDYFNAIDCTSSNDLRKVNEIPFPYQEVFSAYPCFNSVQSKVLDDVLYTDESVVVCAPTGSGKTAIFELALIRALVSFGSDILSTLFKVVYICPMKALCEERLIDWHKKFSQFGLNCVSVTGDSDHSDFQSLLNHNLIITTPEKWDSLTRKWKENKQHIQLFKLVMIDEIHLLNEEGRGSTLETIVSRMKIIGNSCSYVENEGVNPKIRFVTVSATIPNIEDIADWIGCSKRAKFFKFSEDMRPVKLNRIVCGYPYNTNNSSYFKFDLTLNYKLKNLLVQYSNGKPTLIFCNTRKSTEMTSKFIIQNLTINLNQDQKRKLTDAAKSITNKKVSDMLIYGVSYHHAGLLPNTRHAIENLFRNNDLPILVTTSTLAMGVNLPAHLVIIKSTKYYNQGGYQDYTESAILQMIGRAGRPQYDTFATALILTTTFDKKKYENMVDGQQPIESNLHKHLTEHLNAEVVLRTITGLDVAMDWLSSTFLYIRARKNPKYYGLSPLLSAEQIDKKLLEMCQIEINKLVSFKMLILNQDIAITPTVLGTIMAKYCIAFETMKIFSQIKGTETMPEILTIISKCHEFSEMYLRNDDKKCLNLLNNCSNRQTIRFPLNGKIKTVNMKINCIIQAIFGCLEIANHSIITEAIKIMRNGERISKCLIEYLETRQKSYTALLNSVTLAKCFHAQLWENTPYVTKQLQGIGKALSHQLMSAKKSSFNAILESHPREIEMIIKRKPPMGNTIVEEVKHLPQYELILTNISSSDKKQLKLTIILKNAADLEIKSTAKLNSSMCLLVGDTENNLLLYEKYMHSYMIENPEVIKYIPLDYPFPDFVEANFISSDWVGFDCISKYYFVEPPSQPIEDDTNKQTCKNTKTSNNKASHNKNNPLAFNSSIQKKVDSYFKKQKKKQQNIKQVILEKHHIKQNCSKPNKTNSIENTPNLKNLKKYKSNNIAQSKAGQNNNSVTVINSELTSKNLEKNNLQSNGDNPLKQYNNEGLTKKPNSLYTNTKLNEHNLNTNTSNIINKQNCTTYNNTYSLNLMESTNNTHNPNETYTYPEQNSKTENILYDENDNNEANYYYEDKIQEGDVNDNNNYIEENFLPSHNSLINYNKSCMEDINNTLSTAKEKKIVILENIKLKSRDNTRGYSEGFSSRVPANQTLTFPLNKVDIFERECNASTPENENVLTSENDTYPNESVHNNIDLNVFKSNDIIDHTKRKTNYVAMKSEKSLNSIPQKRKLDMNQWRYEGANKKFSQESRNVGNYSYSASEALTPRKKPKYDETLEREADYIISRGNSNTFPLQHKENQPKSISWRSPLVHSPAKKFTPKMKPTSTTANYSGDLFLRNDSYSDTTNTTIEAPSSKNVQTQVNRFKLPKNAKMNDSSSEKFPVTDTDCLQSTSSASSQEEINNSHQSKEIDASFSNLCSSQFLEQVGVKDNKLKLDLLNKKENEISSSCDYYSKFIYKNIKKMDNDGELSETKRKNIIIKEDVANKSEVNKDGISINKNFDKIQVGTPTFLNKKKQYHTTSQPSVSGQRDGVYKSSFLEQSVNSSQFLKPQDIFVDQFQNEQYFNTNEVPQNSFQFSATSPREHTNYRKLQALPQLSNNENMVRPYRNSLDNLNDYTLKENIIPSQDENVLNQTMYYHRNNIQAPPNNNSNNIQIMSNDTYYPQNVRDDNNYYINQNEVHNNCPLHTYDGGMFVNTPYSRFDYQRNQPDFSNSIQLRNNNVHYHEKCIQHPSVDGFNNVEYYPNNIVPNINKQILNRTQLIENDPNFNNVEYYPNNINPNITQQILNRTQLIENDPNTTNYIPKCSLVSRPYRPTNPYLYEYTKPVSKRNPDNYYPDNVNKHIYRQNSDNSEKNLFLSQLPSFENFSSNPSQRVLEQNLNNTFHPNMIHDNNTTGAFLGINHGYQSANMFNNIEDKNYVMDRFMSSFNNERIERGSHI